MNEREINAGLAQTPGYQYARRVGDQLFVAGQVPTNSAGEIIGISDCYKQAQKCLENLLLVLGCHDFNSADIQHLKIYVIGDREQLGEAWNAITAHFPNGVPPATLLGIRSLGYEHQQVEIDAVVIKSRS